MLTHQKIQTLIRLRDEFRDINPHPDPNIRGFSVGLIDEDNFFEYFACFAGPRGTPYVGGILYVILKFPDNYPSSPPKVIFKTPIYHMNVRARADGNGSLGEPNLNILNQWKPEFKVKDILVSIYSLCYMNNIDCAFSSDMAEEFRNNKSLYEEKIKYFTRKYANPINYRREYDNWDFTYNN